jgi:hypothetical protein
VVGLNEEFNYWQKFKKSLRSIRAIVIRSPWPRRFPTEALSGNWAIRWRRHRERVIGHSAFAGAVIKQQKPSECFRSVTRLAYSFELRFLGSSAACSFEQRAEGFDWRGVGEIAGCRTMGHK